MALTLGDNFSYQGAKPLDARLKYDTLAAMKAVADSTMYDGCMAYCVATDKTYQWKSTNEVDPDTGKWSEYSSGQTIQVDTLPTAGADELGNVYQYIGSTTLTLTHGYFYECVSDGAGTPTYSWEEVSTSKGGHDIKNNGVAVTERGVMNFTDFDIADDSTNLETDIKAHRLTLAEMTEIMSTLPGVPTELPILYDETGAEQVVGWHKLANGTKLPVYRKIIDCGSIPSGANQNYLLTTLTGISHFYPLCIYTYFDATGIGIPRRTLPYLQIGESEPYGLSAWHSINASDEVEIHCQTVMDRSNMGKIAVVAEYTKNSDTPS